MGTLIGHEGVIKLLLEREDVDPNRPNKYDRTPLGCAARKGHEGVVKLLLERGDINPNRPDENDQTPLGLAAIEGHKGVVKLLLERGDVDPNRPDKYGGTPLSHALGKGHGNIVQLLQARKSGETPDAQLPHQQCSQPSGGPAGPRGGTAKSPGRDGTASCSPSRPP